MYISGDTEQQESKTGLRSVCDCDEVKAILQGDALQQCSRFVSL